MKTTTEIRSAPTREGAEAEAVAALSSRTARGVLLGLVVCSGPLGDGTGWSASATATVV